MLNYNVPDFDFRLKGVFSISLDAHKMGYSAIPLGIIVIKDKTMLDNLSQCSPYAHAAAAAPLAIVVCGDLSLEIHKGYWVQDCSAAVENMLIEITHLNLGGVWLGVYPLQERIDYIKKLFDLPEPIIPFAIIPIGYPRTEHKPIDRFQSSRIHHEKW